MGEHGSPRPVRFLGWVSLFTDAATEIIYPLLPVYVSRVLGANAMSLEPGTSNVESPTPNPESRL
jgi:hypothetical protein